MTPRLCNSDGTAPARRDLRDLPRRLRGAGDRRIGCCGNGSCGAGGNPCRCPPTAAPSSRMSSRAGTTSTDDCDGTRSTVPTWAAALTPCLCAGVDHDRLSDTYPCDCDDSNPCGLGRAGRCARRLSVACRSGRSCASTGRALQARPGPESTVTYERSALWQFARLHELGRVRLRCPNPSVPSAADAADPGPGRSCYYHARARNGCPQGIRLSATTPDNRAVPSGTCP